MASGCWPVGDFISWVIDEGGYGIYPSILIEVIEHHLDRSLAARPGNAGLTYILLKPGTVQRLSGPGPNDPRAAGSAAPMFTPGHYQPLSPRPGQ